MQVREQAPDLRAAIREGRKVICMRTFKIWAQSLHVGYAYADPELIALQRVRQPFNVNLVAQAAATAALSDHDFVEMCRRENESGRRQLCGGLRHWVLRPTAGRRTLCSVGSEMGLLCSRPCRHVA